MLIRNKVSSTVALLLIAGMIVGLAGCGGAKEQKPIEKAPIADEVKKYSAEPEISLFRSESGATNNLKLEEYLKGVIAGEIGDEFPEEALKAQAIVARTMTLALMEYEGGARAKHNTDASDDHTEFQAYDENAISDKISKAVDATRGQVLLYQGKFAYALFHSVSQDKTASIEEGFPKLAEKASYLVPVDTNGIKIAPAKYKNWTVEVPKSEIIGIMGSEAGDLSDIKVAEKGPSGRALKITAGKASIAGVDLRQEVGFDRLFSTIFDSIEVKGDNVVFKGSGWGHGVGMEQWGARLMAEEGKNAQQIVEHYFPKTEFHQLYD